MEKQGGNDKSSIRNVLKTQGIEWIPTTYFPFGWAAFFLWSLQGIRLYRLILKDGISFIHCWGTPAGAIGYFLSRLSGRYLVLDSYEPHAEAMLENGTWARNGLAFKTLFWLEKKQTQQAVFFISATHGMAQYARKKYGIEPHPFFVKPAGVDLELFNLGAVKRADIMSSLGLRTEDIVCVYAGKFGGIYLDQEVFDFFAVAERYWKDRFRIVLLTNTPLEIIHQYCHNSGLDAEKIIVRFVAHYEMPAHMGVADFAITPVKPVASKRYCTPIKDGEYWALGLPVVIPANISDDSDIIKEQDIGAVLYEFNESAYLKAVEKIDSLIQRPGLRSTIRKVAAQYRSFDLAERIYNELYSYD